jgi:hypothetical protein
VLEKRMKNVLGSKTSEVIGVKVKGEVNPRTGREDPEGE